MKALGVAILMVSSAMFAVASGGSDSHDGISGAAPPSDAFSILGSDLLFSRGDDFRWTLEDKHLNIQTTSNDRYRVEVVTPNVVRLCWPNITDECSNARYLIRIGSPEYERMIAFRQCVDANRGRNLFEVKECKLPFAVPED